MDNEINTRTSQYLTFSLDRERYSFEVFQVREVLELVNITRVPKMPVYMLGVINLRGSVVPVVDLRLKFGLNTRKETLDSSIIILEVELDDGEEILLGAFVDSVHAVIDLDDSQIVPAPRIGIKLDTAFIQGMGKIEEDFIIILNINKIFSKEEILSLGDAEDNSEVEQE